MVSSLGLESVSSLLFMQIPSEDIFFLYFCSLKARAHCLFALRSEVELKKIATLNYKELFRRVLALLSAPGKAWNDIKAENAGRQAMMGFAYPLIGLCGLAEFVGTLFKGGDAASLLFQEAMTRCCAVAVSLFGGLFLSAYLLNLLNRKWTKTDIPYERMLSFVAYAMVVIFVLNIVRGLFPEAIVLHLILQLYTIVIAFEGIRRWLGMREDLQTAFAVVATIVLLLCPAVIEVVFNKLSVILN